MNINLPPRPQPQFYTPRNTGRDPRYARSGIGSGYHASDKVRYIHANYRFIVNPTGDYRAQSLDADVPLDWANVLQILVSSESQAAQCPICLSERGIAPRMAKCGHISCLPCLIRYMHSEDGDDKDKQPLKKAKWKKCPMCSGSIYMGDTRPVRWFAGQENPAPKEGEDVILRLVMRQPGSTLALPKEDAENMGKTDDVPWYFAPEVTDYARVMKGTEEYMVDEYDAEIEALRKEADADKLLFEQEDIWARKAVNNVRGAKEKIVGVGNAPEVKQQARKEKKPAVPEIKYIDEAPATTYTKIHDGQTSADASTPGTTIRPDEADPTAPPNVQVVDDGMGSLAVTAQDRSEPAAPVLMVPTTSAKPAQHVPFAHSHAPYYFYQSLPHYYLAPLDIRILKAAFGSFENFPSTLLPRVEHVSTGHIVDDEFRKKTKYLAHLPYGCEVAFLECNWTDVVHDTVLAGFQTEIKKRRERNREKENREEKARARAEKLGEEERWGRRQRRGAEAFGTSPVEERFGADDFVPLRTGIDGAQGASPPYATDSRPGFGSLSEADSEARERERQATVWGTSVLAPQDEEGYRHNGGDDGWLLNWEKELRAENEVAVAAAQAASLGVEDFGEGGSRPAGNANGGGGGKRKKKQKITLMSTTARRAA